jgi:hypothetical protein
LTQKTQVGPHTPVGIQLEKAEVGPTSGPTWRPSHLWSRLRLPSSVVFCPPLVLPSR